MGRVVLALLGDRHGDRDQHRVRRAERPEEGASRGTVRQGISILALSTYDTDWILVPFERADAAAEEWRRRGHAVGPATPAHVQEHP